jgi:hypothetical protein
MAGSGESGPAGSTAVILKKLQWVYFATFAVLVLSSVVFLLFFNAEHPLNF